eukprot:scaffold26923_cov157-Isochrysis_galbana.AAC.3
MNRYSAQRARLICGAMRHAHPSGCYRFSSKPLCFAGGTIASMVAPVLLPAIHTVHRRNKARAGAADELLHRSPARSAARERAGYRSRAGEEATATPQCGRRVAAANQSRSRGRGTAHAPGMMS